MKICIIMPASLVTKILQIDQLIKDFYSSGQKNGDVCSVPPRLDGVPDYLRSRLLAGHGASPRAQYCSVPFRLTIHSGRLTLKPRLHFTIRVRERRQSWWLSLALLEFEIDSPVFIVILVALADFEAVRDRLLLTNVRSS